MTLDTKRFFVIGVVFCALFFSSRSPATAQLKLFLNFDDSNYVMRKDALSGRESADYWGTSAFEKNYLVVTALGKPSPAGGHYLSLNGSTDFIKLPSNAATNIRGQVAYSVSCWIYLPTERTDGEIINASDNFLSGYRFYLEENVPKLEILEGASEIVSSGVRLGSQRWYHIGFFLDGVGDTVLLFVNGSAVMASTFSKSTQVNTGPNAYIGALITSANPNYLGGHLDDIRFFVGKDTVFDEVAAWAENESETSSPRRSEPTSFILSQNYPNPFNLSTTISFELKRNGYVELQVYDMLGNMLKTITQGELSAGNHDFSWEAQDKNGRALPSGIYFLRMTFNGAIQTKKMILVK